MTTVSVGIVTTDRLHGEGLIRILSSDDSIGVRTRWYGRYSPEGVRAQPTDVLLVDYRIERVLDFCQEVARGVGPAILLILAPVNEDVFCRALSAGVRGLLAPDARPDDLTKAVHVLARGEIWASRQAIVAWVERIVRASRPTTGVTAALRARLSGRELEVFEHAVLGMGNKELAGRLGISEATVKVHLTHIFQKLGVQGRGQLAAAAHALSSSVQTPRSLDGVAP